MTSIAFRALSLCAVVALSLAYDARPAAAQQGSYLGRGLTLPQGQFRIDLLPSNWGYADHGELNSGRGLRIVDPPFGETAVGIGAGGAYGITSQFEVGALLVPLQFAPDSDLGDLEAYALYAFTPGGNIGVQATLQLPTESDFGLGFGLPAFFALGGSGRIETGIEAEIIFADDAYVNIDVPVALQFALGSNAYAGLRTGLFVPDLDDVAINLGADIGFSVTPKIDLGGSFNWPFFLWTGEVLDTVNADWIEIILGATFYLP